MRTAASVLLAAALLLAARASFAALDTGRYGVLLLGEGGADLWTQTAQNNGNGPWSKTLEDVRKALGPEVPFAFAQGEADGRNLQDAVDALQDARVRQIVVVPLFLSSQSPVMDQTRFLLGLREKPSEAFLNAPHATIGEAPQRLLVKVPLVLSKALDDSAALTEALAARGKALSPKPEGDTLVLIGVPPSSKDDAVAWAGSMSSLAQKAGALAGFPRSRALALELTSDEDARDRSETEIRRTLRQLRGQGGVCIVLVELASGEASLRLEDLLEGAFARSDLRPLLPDARLVQWVKQSAQDASRLPDMRLYKRRDAGLTPAPPLSFDHKLSIGSQGGTP